MQIDQPDTRERLKRRVSRYLTHSLPAEIVRRVLPQAADSARILCAYCFRHGFRNLKVREVAGWLQRDPTALNRQLRTARLRNAKHIIDYARSLHAAYHLDTVRGGPAAAARLLDYPSASAFAIDVRRWTGHSPSGLQQRGAIETVVRVITSEIQRPAE